MTKSPNLLIVAITLLFTGCYDPGISKVNYPKVPDEVFANNNLITFFKNTKNPNVVLRVPNNNDKVTSNTSVNKDINSLYNAIEKELLKQNFSVRDRGLFNELLNKSQTSDYSKIKELTNTDLILEVIDINPSVLYTTNKVTTTLKGKTKEKIQYKDYKKYGASVEFRIILVKNNEIAGTYKYNYQPCPDGCEIGTFTSSKNNNKQLDLKETISVNTLEEFIKRCTQDLIKSFRS